MLLIYRTLCCDYEQSFNISVFCIQLYSIYVRRCSENLKK